MKTAGKYRNIDNSGALESNVRTFSYEHSYRLV